MFSWEIDAVIKQNNYIVSSDIYINICSTSPQINHIHYDSFGNYFEIWTSDEYYWRFQVKKGNIL